MPFYTSLQRQNHRKDYGFGEVYALATPDKRLLPFQIIRDTRANAITQATLKSLDGATSADILATLNATGLRINRYEPQGYDVIIYPGVLPLTVDTPEGVYYVELYDGVDRFYSDVFSVVRSMEGFLKIEFWDESSLVFDNGLIDYSTTFKFNLYLKTQLGRPEYPFEEQVEDRDGYTFVEKQVSEKTFKFNFVAPEYLLDAMRLIRMSDNVIVYNKGEVYDVDTFLISPKWEDGGYLASVEAEFQCDTVLKKIGGAVLAPSGGGFNNDFNNDFKIN